MKKTLQIIALTTAILLAACSPTVTPTPLVPADTLSPAGGQPNAGATAANPLPAGVTTAPATVLAPQPNAGSIPLQVLTPEDGATVDSAQLSVSGVTSPGAVVTVNDAIGIAGGDGTFQATVTLDAGPNLIEVIASDSAGNQATLDLTVTYGQ